ncbi:hypothetical protein [Chryseobacterium indoltheticum]|uniref:Uncharacterized protein n=1 Tax=Chryseobacterium indoltheticum TaxID=254 RepID=A0A381FQN8_9FLAO|nr:hypothetical protein [Chryseobacterium indoltheticum]SUX48880.1 Uncharacterised protein [Chryseobacterium indoltheticum]
MKNKFISKLLLLVAIATLYSCRNNELLTEAETFNNSSQFQFTSKTISLKESKHQSKLITELQKVEDNLKKIKAKASVKTIDYKNGVTINTDKVLFIETGNNLYSYTFNIQRDNQSENAPLENLVLSPLANGTYKELLVSYNLTSQEKHTLLIGGTIDTKNKVTVTELTKGTFNDNGQLEKTITGSTCGYEEEQVWVSCSEHVHNQNNVSDWTECTATEGPRMYTIITWKCHYTTDAGTPGNPGGGGGGYPGGGTGEPGTPTQPVVLSYFPIFVKNLPADLKAIINAPENIEFYNNLFNYYDVSYGTDDVKNLIKWSLEFKKSNSVTWEEFQPMLTFAHNFLQENPDTQNPEQIFTRIKDLNNALIQNPSLLLNIPCSQLPAWQELANHPIPVSVKNKIFQVNGVTGWFDEAVIQDLDYSKSYTINMDVYPVKISNMPDKSPGVKYTPAEFFDYFRRNINDFTDINHGKFYPVVEPQYNIDDTQLWNSSNPMGALITIKIPADNGTVVCSGFGAQAWIFTTVKSPWDGEHPVSGNRLFGYYVDSSGDMIIYTRGVDRFTTKTHGGFQYALENLGYTSAQAMWETMQQKVSAFVNGKNGGASIIPGIDYTPNYIFVKDYLKGKKPLTALGCH